MADVIFINNNVSLPFPPSPPLAPLLTLLGSAPPEVVHICLQHIEIILSQNQTLFTSDYQNFYYRYKRKGERKGEGGRKKEEGES